jgi:hypothetical protein
MWFVKSLLDIKNLFLFLWVYNVYSIAQVYNANLSKSGIYMYMYDHTFYDAKE